MHSIYALDLSDDASGKEPACHCRRHKRRRFNTWVRKMPWRKKWNSLQYSYLKQTMTEEPGGLYSPWGHKELDITEVDLAHTNAYMH